MFIDGSLIELFVHWMLEPVELGLYFSPETVLTLPSLRQSLGL